MIYCYIFREHKIKKIRNKSTKILQHCSQMLSIVSFIEEEEQNKWTAKSKGVEKLSLQNFIALKVYSNHTYSQQKSVSFYAIKLIKDIFNNSIKIEKTQRYICTRKSEDYF